MNTSLCSMHDREGMAPPPGPRREPQPGKPAKSPLKKDYGKRPPSEPRRAPPPRPKKP